MMDAVERLVAYGVYLLPGLALIAAWYVLVPRKALGLSIAILILGFVLMRDALTPLGLWAPGNDLTIAFVDNGFILAGLGLTSLALVALLMRFEPALAALMVWRKNNTGIGLTVGLAAGVLVALPVLFLNGFAPERFTLHFGWLLGMFVLAYGGNALEEVLFRGFLQGYLERLTTPLRAALASGVAFGACHGMLALTVTDIGWPILAFTLAEGIACGLVRMRYGVVPAILTHGTAIFLIATPMLG